MKRKSRRFPADKKTVPVNWILNAADRTSQRKALAEKWLEENQYTIYQYYVETCEDGARIYLHRPTWKNKGFDFEVRLEGFRSTTRTTRGGGVGRPSHDDIADALTKKLTARPDLSEDLFQAVCDVYDCVEPSVILQGRPHLQKLEPGIPMEKLLKVLKWLFVEQDLTYWLGTGRDKLMSGIERDVFGLDADLIEE